MLFVNPNYLKKKKKDFIESMENFTDIFVDNMDDQSVVINTRPLALLSGGNILPVLVIYYQNN